MLSTPRQIHALALYCLHRHRSIYTVRGLTERYEYKTKDHRIVAHFADGRVRPLSMHNHVILRTATKTRSKKDVPVSLFTPGLRGGTQNHVVVHGQWTDTAVGEVRGARWSCFLFIPFRQATKCQAPLTL